MIRSLCRFTALMFAWSAIASLLGAAEVDLEEGQFTIDGIQILRAEGGKGSAFYYLPPEVRLAKDQKGEPAVMLVKYNLAVDHGYTVADTDGSHKKAPQGGILALEATYVLDEGRRRAVETRLREVTKKPDATLALIPLDKATIVLEFVDPQKGLVTIGPENAPLNGNTISWVVPLSKPATDIMWDVFNKPGSTAVLRAKVAFEYTGYTSPLMVTVRGDWNNVYNHESWNLAAKGGWWIFSARADFQRVLDQMQQDGTLKITWKGPKDDQVQKLVDRLWDELSKAVFDTSYFKIEEPAKAEKPGGWFGVSYASKKVRRERTGHFYFDFERKEKVSRADSRFSKFSDLNGLAGNDRHFRLVKAGDWGLVAPRVYVNADMGKYAKVVVDVRYGSDAPAAALFSAATGLTNQVPREWNVDETRPKEKRYEYEYRVTATLKDGLFRPAQVPEQQFQSEWLKSSEPFLMVTPGVWRGPTPVKLQVAVLDDLEAREVQTAAVKVTWNNRGKPFSKTFIIKPGKQEHLFEDFLLFDQPPSYRAEVTWWGRDGRKHGPVALDGKNATLSTEELLIPVLQE